jgi:hypothetical protein
MENPNQTELDFLFQNSPINYIREPEFKLNIEFSNVDKKENESQIATAIKTAQTILFVEEPKKIYPKRFIYNDYYEIYYSNRKNRIMVRNYKTMKYHNIKLSSFILRYHVGLNQDNTHETRISKMVIKYFELQLTKGRILCDFFINENDGQLWITIKTPFNEYLYDITTHFLVFCCNQGEYEWYSLFDCDYVDYFIDYQVASNRAQFTILIDWIHETLKHIFLTFRDTTN